MCRLAVYRGPEIPLEQLLLHPAHSLMKQSWGPQEMREGKLNADGYGFAWFDRQNKPSAYTNPMPIWTDPNLPALGRTLASSMWLANVRSATVCSDVSHANTQPFIDDSFIFLHNGYIKDFALTLRHWLRCQLIPGIDAHIRGSTDSEHLFALFRQIMVDNPDYTISNGLVRLMEIITEGLGKAKGLLNIVVANSQQIVALRHAVNGECPSLYYTTDDKDYADASLIASERLTPSGSWQAVPEHHLLIVDPDKSIEIVPL
ncbi:MAG: ergothioneine biosynthesis protein EgtC [Gammaproteobacteria bacterium]|nr:MAG: ergothioneine biosynthesis protein EgtC [Gammaproteobacteria bacterium]